MKIKDLPGDPSLGMVRFIYPYDGKPYYWLSQWQKGVWGKEAANSSRLHHLEKRGEEYVTLGKIQLL